MQKLWIYLNIHTWPYCCSRVTCFTLSSIAEDHFQYPRTEVQRAVKISGCRSCLAPNIYITASLPNEKSHDTLHHWFVLGRHVSNVILPRPQLWTCCTWYHVFCNRKEETLTGACLCGGQRWYQHLLESDWPPQYPPPHQLNGSRILYVIFTYQVLSTCVLASSSQQLADVKLKLDGRIVWNKSTGMCNVNHGVCSFCYKINISSFNWINKLWLVTTIVIPIRKAGEHTFLSQ